MTEVPPKASPHRWVVLAILVSLLPLYARQFDHYGNAGLANRAYVIALVVVLVAAGALAAQRPVLALFCDNLARSPLAWLYCVCLALTQLAVSIGSHDLMMGDAFRVGGYVAVTVIGFVLFPCALHRRGMDAWWNLLFLIGSVVAGLGLYTVVTGSTSFLGIRLALSSPFLGIHAVSGPFHEANIFGFTCLLGFTAGLYRLGACRTIGARCLTLLLMSLCVAGVFWSWSRAMYVALPLAMAVWVLVGVGPLARKLLMVGGAFLAVGLWLAIQASPFASSVLQLEIGLSGRDILWPAAIAAIADRPLTGHGMNGDLLINVVNRYGGWMLGAPMPAHNGFLDLGVQAGLSVPLVYILVIGVAFWRLLRSPAPMGVKRALAASLTVAVVAATFLSYSLGGASYTSLALTILLGIANAAPVLYPERVEAPRAEPAAL